MDRIKARFVAKLQEAEKRIQSRLDSALEELKSIPVNMAEELKQKLGGALKVTPFTKVPKRGGIDLAKFFSLIRPIMPRGKLTGSQVKGIEAILASWPDAPHMHMAYGLATAYHETGARMVPVREGFARTNASAIKAVTSLYRRGKIVTNYALPNAAGQSFYGRGIVQLTWEENYRKIGDGLNLPLVIKPDMMLVPEHSARAMWYGMRNGTFRKGRSLNSMLPQGKRPTAASWAAARDIINGDVRKNGPLIGKYAEHFYEALLRASE